MIETSLVLHDDLEAFAQYLGVDYEDYYELYLGIVQDEEDESLVAVGDYSPGMTQNSSFISLTFFI
jgi:hypothetical protein